MRSIRVSLLAAAAVAISVGASAAAEMKTVWDGVYTKEQAGRGEQTYLRACAYCHRDDLRGDEGPALIGSRFTFQWQGRSLKDLFDTISTTMPADAAGSLATDQYVEVIGFLLQKNGAPSGDAALAADPDVLAAIAFAEKPKR